MINKSFRVGALGAALLATTGLTAPAFAQTSEPAHRAIDANGVDLISGTYPFALAEGTIGSGPGAITVERHGTDPGGVGNWQNMWAYQSTSGGTTTVSVVLGDRSERYTYTGSSYTPAQNNGATLTGGGTSGFTHTAADGTVITLGAPADDQYGTSNLCSHFNSDQTNCYAVATNLTQPDGLTVTFGWDVSANCATVFNSDGSLDCSYAWRLDTVANSFGYAVDFDYVTNFVGSHQNPAPNWYKRAGETLSNGSTTATVSNTFVSSTVTDVTDSNGRTWRITNGTNTLGIRRPGSSSDDISVTFSGGLVTQVVRDGITTGYSRSVSGNTATTTITDAASHVTTVVADTSIGRITSITDALSHQTQYSYDGNGRLLQETRPETDYTAYTYDGRGNVTEVRRVAKSGTGLGDIVTSASYESSCSHVWCNLPLTTTDERGNVTDYTYDDSHGGVLTVTGPAPGGVDSGPRPQTRYSYALTEGVYLLTGISACATGSTASPTCVDMSDETRTVIGYDASGNITSVADRSGNSSGTGAVSATSTMTYDDFGNLVTVDGPLTGTDDSTRYRYDSARQLVGVIGPDPDGSGSLHHRATRVTYSTGGQVATVERGTVNSQSDSDWTGFSPLEQLDVEFDSHQRPVVQRLVSGSTTHQLTQTSYDSLGRANCVAQRMNPSQFAISSLPSDACTLDTTGSYGADRIVKTSFDDAGRPNLVQTGYGVSGVQADEVAATYTNNGQVATVTDAEGNRTSYTYDGHDRPARTYMPSPTTDNTSSTTDYEELTYVLAAGGTRSTSLVVGRRLRDGTSHAYSYDALGRLTDRNVPNSAYAEYDSTYGYDLLGRLTAASQIGANSVSFSFDALGRRTAETSAFGTKTMQYDLAGRLTRLTWPDSFQIGYVYNAAGDLTEIRESPSGANLALVSYSYNNFGARTAVSRYNMADTSYGYDAAGRMTQIVHDLNGTASDVTLGLGLNPAGQIASTTRSNDSYAWTGHYALSRNYTANGLNQYSASGPAALSYDGRGNLAQSSGTGLPTLDYAYTSENRLSEGPGSALIVYDPFGRFLQLYNYDTSAHYQRFDSLGSTLISELDTNNVITRRYVPGPGTDEPVVWYEGSGTGTRRYYHADERGSVIAVSDASGNAHAVNSYDEYGFPGAGNAGRFQYTGQPWVPELGLHHYRARMYSPSLGRFMQTDPIGYGDGMNFYAYVQNDPVNFTDPSGLGHWRCPTVFVDDQHAGRPGNSCVWIEDNKDRVPNDPRVPGTDQPPGTGPAPPPLPPHCRRARDRAAASRGDIPGYIGQNNTYNDIGALQRSAQTYRENAAEFSRMSHVTGLGGVGTSQLFVRGLMGGPVAGLVGGALGAATWYSRNRMDHYEAAARAMEARIEQLRLMNEGECPRDH